MWLTVKWSMPETFWVTLDSRTAKVDLELARTTVARRRPCCHVSSEATFHMSWKSPARTATKHGLRWKGCEEKWKRGQGLPGTQGNLQSPTGNEDQSLRVGGRCVASATAHVKLLEEGTPPEMIAEAEAQLDTMKANLEHAKLGLAFCSITSPIQGIVVQLLARQGQFFNQASPLATVMDLSEIFVHLRIPGADLPTFKRNRGRNCPEPRSLDGRFRERSFALAARRTR